MSLRLTALQEWGTKHQDFFTSAMLVQYNIMPNSGHKLRLFTV